MKSTHARYLVKMLSVLVIALCFSLSPSPTAQMGSGVGAGQAAPTLDQLREQIFIPTCATASCHSSRRAVGGLVLDGFNAYASLVDVLAENPTAREKGKRRVVPGQPDESFLYQKITGRLMPDEGDQMPQTGIPLPPEQIEMIRQWILRRALPSSTKDIQLPVPDPGAQVIVPPFEIPLGSEIQGQYYTALSNTEELRVTRFEVLYPPGSHHLDFFAYQGCSEECQRSTGCNEPLPDGTFLKTFMPVPLCSWALRAFNQRIHQIWDLPPGVAFKFSPRQPVMAQPHYVNTGLQMAPIGGMAVINLHAAFDPAEAPITMGTMFGQNFQVDLPPRSTTMWDMGVTFDQFETDLRSPNSPPIINHDVAIAAVDGHFHWRGRTFEVRRWDGLNRVTQGNSRGLPVGCRPCLPGQDTSWTEFDRMGERNSIYRSDNWDDPPFVTYTDNPIQLPASWGIVYRVTFVNNTNMRIRFGPHVESDEHASVFVYFYPGPADGRTLVFPRPIID